VIHKITVHEERGMRLFQVFRSIVGKRGAGALIAMSFTCSPAAADFVNLIQNGGFKAGDCTSWLDAAIVAQGGQFTGLVPLSGSYFAVGITATQTIADNPGDILQLTFSYAFQGTNLPIVSPLCSSQIRRPRPQQC
jgi:hypothetical protein